jgi:3',5'-nucleoside bisphosphate phosphatase
MYCDLHAHSTASDGTDAPADLPRLAKQAGLSAIALTDHDTTAGLPEFLDAAKRARIKAVPGIELSADPAIFRTTTDATDPDQQTPRIGTLHILGYFIQPDTPHLIQVQERLLNAREQRNPQMIDRLNQLGMDIQYDEVTQAAGGNIVGRPHIGQVMMEKGYVKSIHEAFSKYLGGQGQAYVRKDKLSAQEAINAIHQADGLAVLAHPTQLRLDSTSQLEHAVARLKTLGLDGIETRHSDHTPRDTERFTKLANKLGLITTGGSDYHGSRKILELGSQKVPLAIYENLLNAHHQRVGA